MRIMKKKYFKRKDLMRKMKIIRKQKFQNQSSQDCSEENGDEAKLEMLRSNNSCLARALADQKIETNNWYTEAITLRGELHELREKQIREPVIMNVENMFGETEKQVKEYYESIEVDFNSALDRLVKVVEKLTKVKQLVLGSRTTLENCTQGTPNIFPRTSGSRVTLSSSGVNTAPRQRAVPPMVGGHVLQPVMVPLPKLKIEWNDRTRNHFLVGEDNEHNMSAIGEQSSPENSEVSEQQQSLDAEDDQLQYDVTATPDDNTPNTFELQSQDHLVTNPKTRLSEVQPRRYNLREKTHSPLEQQTPSPVEVHVSNREQRPSRRSRGRGSRRGQGSGSRLSKFHAAESSGQSTEGKEVHTSILDDPLEGPSWLLDVGRSRFYSRCRRKTQRQKRGKKSSDVTLDSSDEESDGIVVSPVLSNGGFQGSRSRKKVSLATAPTDSPPLSLDHSCLDSPSSMRTRLETLEGAGGRRSKRHLKRKQFVESENLEIKGENIFVSLEQDKQINQGIIPNTQSPVAEVGTPKKVVTNVNSITDNKGQSCNTSSAFISRSPVALREDADITCKIVTNMDITMPVSNLVIQENPPVIHENPTVIQENPQTCIEKNIDSSQDELKVTQSKRKFFKTRETELSEEIPVNCEKTPFDLSMLNETVVDVPRFSSTRTTEKENLPPLSAKSPSEYASLCNVSVVLEDVMKQPEYSKTPREFIQSAWKESQSAECIPSHTPRKLRSVSRRTLQYTVNCDEDNEEIEKPKRARKTRRNGESSSSLVNKSRRTNSAKTLVDDEVVDIEFQESEDKKTDPLTDTDIVGKNLEKCIVLLNKTPTIESSVLLEAEPLEVLSDIHQQEQPSEKMEDPQVHDEEVEATSGVSPDTQQESSHVETMINTDFIEKEECEGDTQTGTKNDEPEDDCVVLEDFCDEQIQETQGTSQEQTNSEPPVIAGSPNTAFEGFQSSETSENCRKTAYQMKSFFSKPEKGSPVHYSVEVQDSSDTKSIAEISSGDCGRRRRAALKVSSFKEVALNRKMRRGENNAIIVADSEKGRGRSKSRGSGVKRQRRGRSIAAGKAVEGEASS
ncbi:uncharacterized protein LOC135092236 isoform X1 [Scylla paramamosain]|uniref:uncharacterized protein LOC135092236 isoform X1 n=3 Tax=Scylla paramamosain TaxID=85552 RepID=UPI00308377BF